MLVASFAAHKAFLLLADGIAYQGPVCDAGSDAAGVHLVKGAAQRDRSPVAGVCTITLLVDQHCHGLLPSRWCATEALAGVEDGSQHPAARVTLSQQAVPDAVFSGSSVLGSLQSCADFCWGEVPFEACVGLQSGEPGQVLWGLGNWPVSAVKDVGVVAVELFARDCAER